MDNYGADLNIPYWREWLRKKEKEISKSIRMMWNELYKIADENKRPDVAYNIAFLLLERLIDGVRKGRIYQSTWKSSQEIPKEKRQLIRRAEKAENSINEMLEILEEIADKKLYEDVRGIAFKLSKDIMDQLSEWHERVIGLSSLKVIIDEDVRMVLEQFFSQTKEKLNH